MEDEDLIFGLEMVEMLLINEVGQTERGRPMRGVEPRSTVVNLTSEEFATVLSQVVIGGALAMIDAVRGNNLGNPASFGRSYRGLEAKLATIVNERLVSVGEPDHGRGTGLDLQARMRRLSSNLGAMNPRIGY